jgi:hypothetical protein
MGFDGLFRVERVVAHRGVDVGVAGDDLRDVRWEAGADGIGDEQAAEVVRAKTRGWPIESVRPMKERTSPSALRMNSPDIRDLSPPRSHWNSSGDGGFQTRSS